MNIEDNIKSRVQLLSGKYEKTDRRGKKILHSQEEFYKEAKENYLKAVESEKQRVIKL